jgi:hypothetical protein
MIDPRERERSRDVLKDAKRALCNENTALTLSDREPPPVEGQRGTKFRSISGLQWRKGSGKLERADRSMER